MAHASSSSGKATPEPHEEHAGAAISGQSRGRMAGVALTASEAVAMGCVSAHRVSALRWYLDYQEELVALRQRGGDVADQSTAARQERMALILKLRAEGRTQRDVAAIMGVSPAYVGSVERRILPAIMRYRHRVAELDADLR